MALNRVLQRKFQRYFEGQRIGEKVFNLLKLVFSFTLICVYLKKKPNRLLFYCHTIVSQVAKLTAKPQ